MITIHVTPDDLLQTRFVYSPTFEITSSYFALSLSSCAWLPQRWKDTAYQALYDVELPYLNALVGPQGYAADLLVPHLNTGTSSIEDEFACLLDLPEDAIRSEIHCLIQCAGSNIILQHFLLEPRASMRCLVRDMRTYWERVLKPQWSSVAAILEGDILYRARQLALNGTASVFEDLHAVVRYNDGRIDIDMDCKSHYDINGAGLRLMPTTFFSTTGLYVQWETATYPGPVIAYGARGRGSLSQSVSESEPTLGYALGAGRARVLQVLATPANTGEIARQLELTAGAVSQHLQRLNQAGLVEPHRSGKRVFYHLTDRGEQLLMLFDGS